MWDRLRKAREFLEDVEDSYRAVPPRRTPSLVSQAAIAAIDPGSGKLWTNAEFTLVGAILVELALEGRLEVAGTGKKLSLSLRDPTPLGDQILDDAMLTIGAGVLGQKLTRIVPSVTTGREVLDRLVVEDQLTRESSRTLGVFPTTRYRPTRLAQREALVDRLRSILLDGAAPDARTALLIAALGLSVHPKLWVPRGRVDEANARTEEIGEGVGDTERLLLEGVREMLSDKLDREN